MGINQREVRVLAATGMVGAGYSKESFDRALDWKPDFIGADAGSTDSGPHSLGSGMCNKARQLYKRDIEIMLIAAVKNKIPLIIGSAGTAGGEPHLQWTLDIVREISKEYGLHFKLAAIHAGVRKDVLKEKLRAGKITPLEPMLPFDETTIDRAERFVAVMGVEPIWKALDQGAEVVIGGRMTDTSIYAAIPLKRGFPPGLVWHAAKIIECGAACVTQRLYGDCIFAYIKDDHFVVEPPNPLMRCSPVSVKAHMMYENGDPSKLLEPGGMLDASQSVYEAVRDRAVRVSGSKFIPSDKYTVKLEGAETIGYRGITIAGVRDPVVIRQLDSWLEIVRERVMAKVATSYKGELQQKDLFLKFRVYGKDGVLGAWERMDKSDIYEVGVVIDVVAPTQEIAMGVLQIAWYTGLHSPVKEWSGIISNFAFPFSPPGIPVGPVYAFNVNHVVELKDPCELFPVEILNF